MSLTGILKQEGLDLIDGPVRNHKPLQLWLKEPGDKAELSYLDVNYAFSSEVRLEVWETPALNVNSAQKNEYSFNIGLTILEDILKSLGMGALEISTKFTSGKKVTVSYDNAVSREVPVGPIADYFSTADFLHPNPALLKNANRDNILIVSGVIFARNLVVEIETDFNLDAALVASMNEFANGKLDFRVSAQQKLTMTSTTGDLIPIAVKANRVIYRKGRFKDLELVTDRLDLF